MGLFSFVGKIIKGVSKVAGLIPGIGNTIKGIGGAVGNLLDHKQPLSSTAMKAHLLQRTGSVSVLRAKSSGASSGVITARELQASPVMPGGAIVAGPGGARNAGARGGRASAKRKTTRHTSKKGKPRRKARKLKFGSAAYRKKYLGKRTRRRR